MPTPPEKLNSFKSLTDIVSALRGPDGCPWDKEQTHSTLTQYAIEEAHELAEAIDHGKTEEIVEELGDLLLQVFLHAEIGRQNKQFTMEDVLYAICEKMVRRHPHVFANDKAETSDEVIENWQKIKAAEKVNKTPKDQFDVPATLPALLRSQKIGAKTKKWNFDWNSPQEVLAKIDEEIAELKEAIEFKSPEEQQSELGDALFSLAQLARHLNFDAEQALRKTNSRFEHRFFKMKKLASEDKKAFDKLSALELDHYWQLAKKS